MNEFNLQHNENLVRQYVELFNSGAWDEMRALWSDDALVYGVLGWGDMDTVIPLWTQFHDCLQMNLQIVGLAAQENTVAVRYVERGTSVAPFRGQGPTGKSYEVVAMEWFEIENGKLHRRWGARDSAAIWKQLELNF